MIDKLQLKLEELVDSREKLLKGNDYKDTDTTWLMLGQIIELREIIKILEEL